MCSPARLLSLLAALLFLAQAPLAHLGMAGMGMQAGNTPGRLLHTGSESCDYGAPSASPRAHSGSHGPPKTHSHRDCPCCAPPAVDLPREARLLVPGFGLASSPPQERVFASRRALPTRARDPPFLMTA